MIIFTGPTIIIIKENESITHDTTSNAKTAYQISNYSHSNNWPNLLTVKITHTEVVVKIV